VQQPGHARKVQAAERQQREAERAQEARAEAVLAALPALHHAAPFYDRPESGRDVSRRPWTVPIRRAMRCESPILRVLYRKSNSAR